MIRRTVKTGVVLLVAALLLLPFGDCAAVAANLNPEGINPHKDAPRKRITQEQKQAAADARKNRALVAGKKKAKKAMHHRETSGEKSRPNNEK